MRNRGIQPGIIHDPVESQIPRENVSELQRQLSDIFSRGNLGLRSRELTADTTLSYKDSVIYADTSSASLTITLPYANSWSSKKATFLTIIKTSESNTLTVSPQGSDVLKFWRDGDQQSGDITVVGQAFLVPDGVDTWYVISSSLETTTAARNYLDNSNFMIGQRGLTFDAASPSAGSNNDDTYFLDRWYILSDGNDVIDVGQNLGTIDTYPFFMYMDVETANKKFGIAQIVENKDLYGLVGVPITFSAKVKVLSTTNLDKFKMAIVEWTGTADTVTSDIVSAWNAEGTNPTLIANASYVNTPVVITPTTSWAEYSVTGTVSSSATNIIVFIWSDVTTTSTGSVDVMYVTNCQLEPGLQVSQYHYRSYEEEMAKCQRYFEIATTPLISGDVTAGNSYFDVGYFRVRKRVTPTIVYVYVGTSGAFAASAPLASAADEESWRCYKAATGTAAGAYISYYMICSADL